MVLLNYLKNWIYISLGWISNFMNMSKAYLCTISSFKINPKCVCFFKTGSKTDLGQMNFLVWSYSIGGPHGGL